jgi:hypothetical protein
MVLSLAEYYLIIEAVAILIKNVIVIHYFIGGMFYERLNMMSKSSKLFLIRRCGLIKDAHAFVQHLNPACRVARLYPTLPISRLLISINDVDIRCLTIPQSWTWKHVVATICYMPFNILTFKVGEFIILFVILVVWNVIIFCFCILGEFNDIISISLASVVIGCLLTGSLYVLCVDKRKAQTVNKVMPKMSSLNFNIDDQDNHDDKNADKVEDEYVAKDSFKSFVIDHESIEEIPSILSDSLDKSSNYVGLSDDANDNINDIDNYININEYFKKQSKILPLDNYHHYDNDNNIHHLAPRNNSTIYSNHYDYDNNIHHLAPRNNSTIYNHHYDYDNNIHHLASRNNSTILSRSHKDSLNSNSNSIILLDNHSNYHNYPRQQQQQHGIYQTGQNSVYDKNDRSISNRDQLSNNRFSNSSSKYSSPKNSLYNPLNSSYQSTINSSYKESFLQYSYNEFKHDFDNNNCNYNNNNNSKINEHSTLYLPPLQYDRLSKNHNNIYEPSIMQLNIDNNDDHPFRKNQQQQRQQQFSRNQRLKDVIHHHYRMYNHHAYHTSSSNKVRIKYDSENTVGVNVMDKIINGNSIEIEQLKIKKIPWNHIKANTIYIEDNDNDDAIDYKGDETIDFYDQMNLKHSEFKLGNDYYFDTKTTPINSSLILKRNFNSHHNQQYDSNNNTAYNYIIPSIQSNKEIYFYDLKEEVNMKSNSIKNKIISNDEDFILTLSNSPDIMIDSEISDDEDENDNMNYDYFQVKNETKFDIKCNKPSQSNEIRPTSSQYKTIEKSRLSSLNRNNGDIRPRSAIYHSASQMRPISSFQMYNQERSRSTALQQGGLNELQSTSAQVTNNNRYQSSHRLSNKKTAFNTYEMNSTNQSNQYSRGHHNHHQQYIDGQNHVREVEIDPISSKNISYSRRRVQRTEINSKGKGPGFRDQLADSHPLEALVTNMMTEQDNITRSLNNNSIIYNHIHHITNSKGTFNHFNHDHSNPLDCMLINMVREQDDITKRLNDNIIVKIKLHNNNIHRLNKNNIQLYTPIASTEFNFNNQSIYSIKRY